MFQFIPKVQHQIAELRRVIRGKFHDEGRHFAAHGSLPHERDRDDRHYHAEHVERESQKTAVQIGVMRRERAAHSREDGRLCAAREEGDHAVGHDAFLFVRQRSGVDRRRHGTAETHDHGDKRTARKTEFAERSVEYERHARHIAAVLQNRDEQKQHEDLRNKGQYARKTAPDTVVDQPLRPFRRTCVFHSQRDAAADLVGDKAH